jgi:hypothetical protein
MVHFDLFCYDPKEENVVVFKESFFMARDSTMEMIKSSISTTSSNASVVYINPIRHKQR